MPNSYFEFRQFRISQDRCDMKVTTDACILGAYASAPESGRILDIGAGTGLLSLMMAQRTAASIDAVELDDASYFQLQENVSESPWSARITCIHSDISTHMPSSPYDFIISNPPFFSNQLLSPDENKNRSRHDTTLDADALLHSVKQLLRDSGQFAVLFPYQQLHEFTRKAGFCHLKLSQQLLIRSRPDKPFIRVILIFQSEPPVEVKTEILSVKNESDEYSDFFRRLLQDFYLHL